MNKISIIIKREYLTRVRKKSFIIMTILAPLLMASMVILIPVVMLSGDKDFKKIAVIEDRSDLFRNAIPDTEDEKFEYLQGANINDLIKTFEAAGYYGVLYISPDALNTPQFYSKKQPPIGLLEHISSSLQKEIEKEKLLSYNIQNLDSILRQIRTNVSVSTQLVDETGKLTKTSTGVAMGLAYIGGFLMYMLVFLFGAQVMRGVIEEKTSRVIEVIVSSVKPVELMMGKIIGLALVGLTQFMIWVFLTVGAVAVVKSTVLNKAGLPEITQTLPQDIMSQNQQVNEAIESADISPELAEFSKLFDSAMNQNWILILFSFVFYFITGYLLYASVFAAIGSAVDNETETQQFMLPVTIPIIFALVVAMGTMQNPESSLSFWFSIIPLTSPIVMMARIPFGVPYWQIALSMALMLVTFAAFVWMAAKVYRTGILMYGKKTSWKELWKWLRYSG
jgi:ABC-2 type transport system permease protein